MNARRGMPWRRPGRRDREYGAVGVSRRKRHDEPEAQHSPVVGQLGSAAEEGAVRLTPAAAACAALLPRGEALGRPPPRVSCRWPQEGFQAVFRSLFPAGTVDFELPVLEDLLVQEPFHVYNEYLASVGLASWEPQAPVVASAYRKGIIISCTGVQAGHHFSGRDPTQRVDMGMAKEDHV